MSNQYHPEHNSNHLEHISIQTEDHQEYP